MKLGPSIAPFRRAETDPPGKIIPFFGWALKGAWAGILWAALWSAMAGSLEAVSATLLGMVIDAANSTKPAEVLGVHFYLFAFFAVFYLIARPLVFGLNTASSAFIIAPHCAADIAPVPESVSRSMITSSARSLNTLYPAVASAVSRWSRVVK